MNTLPYFFAINIIVFFLLWRKVELGEGDPDLRLPLRLRPLQRGRGRRGVIQGGEELGRTDQEPVIFFEYLTEEIIAIDKDKRKQFT